MKLFKFFMRMGGGMLLLLFLIGFNFFLISTEQSFLRWLLLDNLGFVYPYLIYIIIITICVFFCNKALSVFDIDKGSKIFLTFLGVLGVLLLLTSVGFL